MFTVPYVLNKVLMQTGCLKRSLVAVKIWFNTAIRVILKKHNMTCGKNNIGTNHEYASKLQLFIIS